MTSCTPILSTLAPPPARALTASRRPPLAIGAGWIVASAAADGDLPMILVQSTRERRARARACSESPFALSGSQSCLNTIEPRYDTQGRQVFVQRLRRDRARYSCFRASGPRQGRRRLARSQNGGAI